MPKLTEDEMRVLTELRGEILNTCLSVIGGVVAMDAHKTQDVLVRIYTLGLRAGIERAAMLQERRSVSRHGRDKYGDAFAIAALKDNPDA